MTGLSLPQIKARLILDARVIILDHWPRLQRADWCPICHWTWPCEPTRIAYAYLTLVGHGRWIPPQYR